MARSAKRICKPTVLEMSALCDYETWLLATYNTELGLPMGMERLTHEPWVRHVQKDLPRSEWTWAQYVEHVEAGQGDEWFLECAPWTPRERTRRPTCRGRWVRPGAY